MDEVDDSTRVTGSVECGEGEGGRRRTVASMRKTVVMSCEPRARQFNEPPVACTRCARPHLEFVADLERAPDGVVLSLDLAPERRAELSLDLAVDVLYRNVTLGAERPADLGVGRRDPDRLAGKVAPDGKVGRVDDERAGRAERARDGPVLALDVDALGRGDRARHEVVKVPELALVRVEEVGVPDLDVLRAQVVEEDGCVGRRDLDVRELEAGERGGEDDSEAGRLDDERVERGEGRGDRDDDVVGQRGAYARERRRCGGLREIGGRSAGEMGDSEEDGGGSAR